MKKRLGFVVLVTVAVVVLVSRVNTDKIKIIPDLSPTPTVCPTCISPFTTKDEDQGWYYGSKNQKKPGTPEDWIYKEAGRSSKWVREYGLDKENKCPEGYKQEKNMGWGKCPNAEARDCPVVNTRCVKQ